ncbi:MAG: hypothetical protein J6P87_08720, partial [Lachnospiraceae bacterium]|nr:hypothetical protein [Lachnospiraceae bacterium]
NHPDLEKTGFSGNSLCGIYAVKGCFLLLAPYVPLRCQLAGIRDYSGSVFPLCTKRVLMASSGVQNCAVLLCWCGMNVLPMDKHMTVPVH